MKVIEYNPLLTTPGKVAMKLWRTHGIINLKQLRLVSKLSQWVSHDLSHNQNKTSNRLRNLITWNEKWCHYVNYKRKHQWLEFGRLQNQVFIPKMMHKGVIYWELLLEKATTDGRQSSIYWRLKSSTRACLGAIIFSAWQCQITYGQKSSKKKRAEFGWEPLLNFFK